MNSFADFWKSGTQHIHSEKFDRCVEEVKRRGDASNAYAVCTAMMGESAFKAMETDQDTDDAFEEKMQLYLNKLGIAGAGPVPNSLLARQDLRRAQPRPFTFDETGQYTGYPGESPDTTKSIMEKHTKLIRQLPSGKWGLYDAHTGKLLSHHTSKAKAEAALRAIEWDKHKAQKSQSFSKHVIHELSNGEWGLYDAHTGKLLSHHSSKAKAEAALRAIEWSKHKSRVVKVVRHEDGKWKLYSNSTGRLLGTHNSKESLMDQERAIHSKKADTSEYEIEDTYARREGQHEHNNWGGKTQKTGSEHDLTIEIHNGSEWAESSESDATLKAAFEGCDLDELQLLMQYEGHQIFLGPDMTDTNGHRVGNYVVLGPDAHQQVFFSIYDAQEYIDGVYDKQYRGKALISDAEKDLDKLTESELSKRTLAEKISAYQEKRQNKVIAARKAKGSFADFWRATS